MSTQFGITAILDAGDPLFNQESFHVVTQNDDYDPLYGRFHGTLAARYPTETIAVAGSSQQLHRGRCPANRQSVRSDEASSPGSREYKQRRIGFDNNGVRTATEEGGEGGAHDETKHIQCSPSATQVLAKSRMKHTSDGHSVANLLPDSLKRDTFGIMVRLTADDTNVEIP